MTKFKAETNIVNKKSIVIVLISMIFTYLITRKNKDGNKKKRSKINTFRKSYSFLDRLYSLVFTKRAKSVIKKDSTDFVVEDAIMIDL